MFDCYENLIKPRHKSILAKINMNKVNYLKKLNKIYILNKIKLIIIYYFQSISYIHFNEIKKLENLWS